MTGASKTNVTGSLVYCGLGKAMSDFPASVAGNIALIKRGDVTFALKAQNAKKAGAKAVIVFNREAGNFGGTLIDVENPPPADYVFLPTVSMSMEDGEALRGMGNQSAVMRFGIFDDYAELQGTSMASPHVAGVVALVWSVSPTATASAVRNAVISSARDLGSAGFDNVYGNGVVDAFAAAKILAPEKIHPGRRRTIRR
jgi:subtilisin family serine protease